MSYFGIGTVVREFRERVNMTQVKLCENICEPSTLCKIENGSLSPSKKMLDKIVQKLNIPLALNIPVTASEFRRAELENEIRSCFSRDEPDVSNLLNEYNGKSKTGVKRPMDKLEKQFYLYANGIYLCNSQKEYEKALSELKEAIKITFPNYTEKYFLNSHILFPIEFSIINNIAICYYRLKALDNAIFIMQQLLQCLENKKMCTEELPKKYPMIAYNLSMWLGLQKQYEKSLSVSQKGIDCCLKYQQYSSLSDLFYNHGYTLIMLNKKEKGKEFIEKSLTFDSIIGRNDRLKNSKKDIEQSFGIDFFSTLKML